MFKDGSDDLGDIKSFLMAGQSNMAGRGDLNEVDPIDDPKCFMLRMGRWQKMSEPVNPDRPVFEGRYHSGVSLAASFADSLSKYSGVRTGLIPCADGGTRIIQWQPGEVLYEHAVLMTRLAMRSSRFSGILWHQGESDCVNFDAEEYRLLFLNTMTSLRRDLQAERLPLIIGEISENISAEHGVDHLREMNALLHQLQKELPVCAIVSAEGLSLKKDGIHFDSRSCRELGKRYFEAYKTLMSI